mgnify:CR=1 FL=1
MPHDKLKKQVYEANLALVDAGVVVLTFGNVSGVDREAGVMAIKPSGVNYSALQPGDIVILSLETGEKIEGTLAPSSDTPTHLHLYREFEVVGGIAHAHPRGATAWAQAGREIPCFGTTHADHFYGPVPVTREMTHEEIDTAYEENTGRVIVERFRKAQIKPDQMPAVLVAGHGPFAWGPSAAKSVENMITLEEVAHMALGTLQLNPAASAISQRLLDKHFLRKHGPGAYYGQKG